MKLLSVFGTRPEVIKMAPLIRQLNRLPGIQHKTCATGQHRQMLKGALRFFGIYPDFQLNVRKAGSDLTDTTVEVLTGLRELFRVFRPDWILVHGDTTTCFAAALAAFYAGIPVAHVEAGLRTHNLSSPFPEEANRILASRLASIHFAPTIRSGKNLLREGIHPKRVMITGNTVVDALAWSSGEVKGFSDKVPKRVHASYESGRRVLLVTCHRRENRGSGLARICAALIRLARKYPTLTIVYPVHLNPFVYKPVFRYLSGVPNICLTAPFDYPDFIFAMRRSWLILTDSGGIQEEAAVLGRPVLLTRKNTERPEASGAGNVLLVGADNLKITRAFNRIWRNSALYNRMSRPSASFGDGHAAERIASFFEYASRREYDARDTAIPDFPFRR